MRDGSAQAPPPSLGSEKYMRLLGPATIATGPQFAPPVGTSCGVGLAKPASNHTSLLSPVTDTHTVPFGALATDVGPLPTSQRPITCPDGVMRATDPLNSSATQKFPSPPRA